MWKKRFFVKSFRKRGEGGLTDFIPLFYFSKHPPNTLQTPWNTLQAPLKHPSTPFKQHSKSSLFFAQKVDGKKINRDFIKGGRGGGQHFMKWFHKKSFFFTNDAFPNSETLKSFVKDSLDFKELRIYNFSAVNRGCFGPSWYQCLVWKSQILLKDTAKRRWEWGRRCES